MSNEIDSAKNHPSWKYGHLTNKEAAMMIAMPTQTHIELVEAIKSALDAKDDQRLAMDEVVAYWDHAGKENKTLRDLLSRCVEGMRPFADWWTDAHSRDRNDIGLNAIQALAALRAEALEVLSAVEATAPPTTPSALSWLAAPVTCAACGEPPEQCSCRNHCPCHGWPVGRCEWRPDSPPVQPLQEQAVPKAGDTSIQRIAGCDVYTVVSRVEAHPSVDDDPYGRVFGLKPTPPSPGEEQALPSLPFEFTCELCHQPRSKHFRGMGCHPGDPDAEEFKPDLGAAGRHIEQLTARAQKAEQERDETRREAIGLRGVLDETKARHSAECFDLRRKRDEARALTIVAQQLHEKVTAERDEAVRLLGISRDAVAANLKRAETAEAALAEAKACNVIFGQKQTGQHISLLRECREVLCQIDEHEFLSYDKAQGGIYEGQYGIGVVDGHRACAKIIRTSGILAKLSPTEPKEGGAS